MNDKEAIHNAFYVRINVDAHTCIIGNIIRDNSSKNSMLHIEKSIFSWRS